MKELNKEELEEAIKEGWGEGTDCWCDNLVEGFTHCTPCLAQLAVKQMFSKIDELARDVEELKALRNGLVNYLSEQDSQFDVLKDDILNIERYKNALKRVEEWVMPETGKFYDDNGKKIPLSYSYCYGSNGERDYIKNIARNALYGKKESTK